MVDGELCAIPPLLHILTTGYLHRTPNAFRHGANFYDDGLIFSDHRPAMVEIDLKTGLFAL